MAEDRPAPKPFSELYRPWRPAALKGARAIVTSDADAEDAAQRVFLRLLRNGGWWDIDDPESYFRRAGRREALNLERMLEFFC